MPAYASHLIFAGDIIDSVREEDPSLRLDENSFLAGAQGPDFLFCHKIWRMAWGGETLKPLGNALHHCCSSKLFETMKKYLTEEKNDADVVKSYIYGFLSHYSLDRLCHPLIYSVQKKITDERNLHHYEPFSVHAWVESNLDSLLINKKGYADARKYRSQDVISLSSHILSELSCLMTYTVPRVMGEEHPEKQYRLAYKHMLLSQKMLYDPKGIKKKILIKCGGKIREKTGPILSSMFKPAVPDGEYDYGNSERKQWAMVFDKTKKFNFSFEDLYNEAKKDVINLIRAFNSENCGQAIKELTDDMTFDTGLNYKIKEPIN